MNPRIKLVTELYEVSERLALKALNEAKPDDLYERPLDKANSFHWVFGHITASRYGLAQSLGLNESVSWEKLYEFGAEVQDFGAYPSIDELKAAFLDITKKLKVRFETLTERDLAGEPPCTIPGLEKSIAGLLAYLFMHESYHVGQLAYLQRLHGGPKLVG